MKKVLFITRKWKPSIGGMETYSLEFAAAAGGLCDLTIIPMSGRKDGRPPGGLPILWFGVRTAMSRLLSNERFDVVHGGDLALWPLLWVSTLRAGNPKATIAVHGSDIAFALKRKWTSGLYKAYLKFAQTCLPGLQCIANSRATEALLREVGFSSVKLVPLLVGSEDQIKAPGDPVSPPYILFVGRLIRRKGCAWFIRSVLPHLDPAITLKVAAVRGDEDEFTALDDPRVEFLGAVRGKPLAKLRRDALCVIVPNLDFGHDSFEGFGLTAAETALDGGVCLAADVFGLRDAVIDGKTGFLLPSGEPEHWVSKIAELQGWNKAERDAFHVQMQTSLREAASWDDIAKATLDL